MAPSSAQRLPEDRGSLHLPNDRGAGDDLGPEPILKPLYSKIKEIVCRKKQALIPAFFDNNLRRSVGEEGRVHSSEGIETFLSMPCCPVWAHIFIFL